MLPLVCNMDRFQLALEVCLSLLAVTDDVELDEVEQVPQFDLALAGLQLELLQICLQMEGCVGNELAMLVLCHNIRLLHLFLQEGNFCFLSLGHHPPFSCALITGA